MLWYKNWRETRTRLLISMLALGWICAVIVLFQGNTRRTEAQPMTYVSYVWSAVYKDYVRNLFIILASVLGGGTLLQESAHGSAGFTLALPTSRPRLMLGRVVVGLGETWLLAFLPGVTIAILSSVVGEHYPLDQAVGFGVLWAAAGTIVFAISQLLSAIIANEYVAWIGSFMVILLYEALVNVTALNRFPTLDLFRLMSGAGTSYFNAIEHTLVGPLPWSALAVTLGLATLILVSADRVLRQRDF